MQDVRGLFLGRFQPFHIGHLDGVEQVLRDCTSVLIVVSSAHLCHMVDHPFTSGERYQMIKHTMLDLGIGPERYDIIPVGDNSSTPAFLATVVSFSPPFHRVYTGNPQIVSLFSSWQYDVRPTRSAVTSGEDVRRRMATDDDWECWVPDATVDLIRAIEGVRRVKLLYQSAIQGDARWNPANPAF
jgi:nicotinamide-nucleotide adenylyltransferase